jgi:phenylalanyl-tRNA synthetase beta chain
MRLSLNWIKRYLHTDLAPEKIAEILTTIGLEVEGIETVEAIKGGLKGVVTGHVKSCEKHPDADKLSVTIVDAGTGEGLQIVCGAPNVAAGQKVFVATAGTTLFTQNGEAFKIKKSKIRGVESNGMICSEAELGLSGDHSGIAVLPDTTVVGADAAAYLGLEDDTVFEIGLTPNRADAMSQLGVARDLIAYLRVNEGYSDDLREPDLSAFVGRKIPVNIKVEVLNKAACPRYTAAVIHNVEVKESPEWLKKLLTSVGVRPINNIVDITNFVLHEMGQPLHAFDADKIVGQKIIVSTLREGTVFIGLDGTERILKADDLMICDGDMKGMCMAGVFGGIGSGVTAETKNIFLESAYFDAGYIRRTSMGHNLRTDAAKVFEKGADPNITEIALKRACILIAEIAGGTSGSDITDIYSKHIPPAEIRLRYDAVNTLMGVNISKEKIHHILQSLEMEISPVDESSILVKVPTNKPDVLREVDLIEEIVRIYGLNNIPVPDQIRSTISYTDYPDKRETLSLCADFLASRGYSEMMGLSLIESSYYQHLEKDNLVYINNTSNIHLDIMRPDMLISGLLSVAYNLNRQQTNLSLFETGKSYHRSGDQYDEHEWITLFKAGQQSEESWKGQNNDTDFYDIKNSLQALLGRLGIDGVNFAEVKSDTLSYGMTISKGEKILGRFGEVSKKMCRIAGIKVSVFYAELNVRILLKSVSANKLKVREISRFPSVRRDLALILNKSVHFRLIEDVAWKTDRKLLKNVNLFDVYEHEQHIGQGKKSYAVSFTFESTDKTLSDEDVDKVMVKLIKNLENEADAYIRK